MVFAAFFASSTETPPNPRSHLPATTSAGTLQAMYAAANTMPKRTSPSVIRSYNTICAKLGRAGNTGMVALNGHTRVAHKIAPRTTSRAPAIRSQPVSVGFSFCFQSGWASPTLGASLATPVLPIYGVGQGGHYRAAPTGVKGIVPTYVRLSSKRERRDASLAGAHIRPFIQNGGCRDRKDTGARSQEC